MGVPVKYYTFVDGQNAAGLLNAARLNGNLDPLYACLNPSSGGLEDTNVKAGAKIVCTDRTHTVTGVWTFTTAPVLPAASVPNAALQSSVMLKTTYDANLDGVIDSAAGGVTGGNSHDHNGGDGAAIVEAAITLADNVTNDVSATKHGFVPKAPNDATKFLRGDATWNVPTGYVLPILSGAFDPTDDTTYYCGGFAADLNNPNTAAAVRRLYVPKAGTIKIAKVVWLAVGTAGTNESISVYIRLNDTTDTLVAAIGDTNAVKVFSKTDLAIAVVDGDYIEIKIVCPTWATNPTSVHIGGSLYIE